MKSSERIFGLDILRTVAILIVLLDHSKKLLKEYFPSFSYIVWPDGVNLFFVLSGYLIGSILISDMENNKGFNFESAFNFLKRRWFRTLPNYYLFLVINIIIFHQFINKYILTYFFFFQNFHVHFDGIFWESWSLAVEEWFYFLLPILLLFFIKVLNFKIKTSLIITIFIFLSLPLIYRIFTSNPELETWRQFRTLVATRLDTIGFGLLGAFIHFYFIEIWGRWKNLLFGIGITSQLLFWFYLFGNTFFNQTFYFSIAGFSILCMLPKLASIKTETIPFKPFQFLSKISYSLYLVHLPLLYFISNYLKASNTAGAILVYLLFWVGAIGVSYLIYWVYEKPMMDFGRKKK